MGNELCGDRISKDEYNFSPNSQTPGPANKGKNEKFEDKTYDDKHEESVNKIASAWRENKIKAKEKENQLNRVKILDKTFSQLGKFITADELKLKIEPRILQLDSKLLTYQGSQIDKSQLSQNLIYKNPFVYDLDNSIYHGFWNLNGLREGYGYLIRSDGSKLEGLWKNGEIFKGRIISTDGSYYEGKIKDAEANGEGNFTDSNGVNVYRGNFLNSDFHGYGMKLFIDKANYQGNFEKNEMHGNGKLTFEDKSLYEGAFIESVINGQGIYKIKEHKYNGEWKDNKPQGEGTYYFNKNGSVYYKGSFFKGRKEGEGKFIDEEKGVKYEGHWSSDKPHGEGLFTNKDLSVLAYWRYGHLVKVIEIKKGETPNNLRVEVPEILFRNLAAEKGHLKGSEYFNSPNKNSPSKNYKVASEGKVVLDSLFKLQPIVKV